MKANQLTTKDLLLEEIKKADLASQLLSRSSITTEQRNKFAGQLQSSKDRIQALKEVLLLEEIKKASEAIKGLKNSKIDAKKRDELAGQLQYSKVKIKELIGDVKVEKFISRLTDLLEDIKLLLLKGDLDDQTKNYLKSIIRPQYNKDLFDAIKKKVPQIDTIQELIEQGADLECVDENGFTPLLLAVTLKKTIIVKTLLKNGANPDVEMYGSTPLDIAISDENTAIVSALMENRAASVDSSTLTPLILSIQNENVRMAKFLIEEKRENVNQKWLGLTPLIVAIPFANLDMIKFLVEAGAEVNGVAKNGMTPLLMAIPTKTRDTDISEGLVDFYNLMNSRSDVSPNSYTEVVKFLIESKANVNQGQKGGETPLYAAAKENLVDMVNLFIQNGAEVDKKTDQGVTPLFMAAQEGHLAVVKVLIGAGAKVNLTGGVDGAAPIHAASQSGHLAVVQYLIECKADISTKLKEKESTPLLLAIKNSHNEIAKLLVKNGVDVGDKSVINPLFVAIAVGNSEMAEFLLEQPKINTDSVINGLTILQFAFTFCPKVVKVLLANQQIQQQNYSQDQHFYIVHFLFSDSFYNSLKSKESQHPAHQFLINTIGSDDKLELFISLVTPQTIGNLTNFILSEDGAGFRECLPLLLIKAKIFGNESAFNKLSTQFIDNYAPPLSESLPNQRALEDKSQLKKDESQDSSLAEQQQESERPVLQAIAADDIATTKTLITNILGCISANQNLNNVSLLPEIQQNFLQYLNTNLLKANNLLLSLNKSKILEERGDNIAKVQETINQLKCQITIYLNKKLLEIDQLVVGEEDTQGLLESCNGVCDEILSNIWKIESIENQINSFEPKQPSPSPSSTKLTDDKLQNAIKAALKSVGGESTVKGSSRSHGAGNEKTRVVRIKKADTETKNKLLITSQFETQIDSMAEKLGNFPENITQEVVDEVLKTVSKMVKFSPTGRGGSHFKQCDDMPKIFPPKNNQEISSQEEIKKYMGFWQSLSEEISKANTKSNSK